MPIPFAAFLPLGIVAAALAGGGILMDYTHRYFNNGKPKRMMMDQWDKMMQVRDDPITGQKH